MMSSIAFTSLGKDLLRWLPDRLASGMGERSGFVESYRGRRQSCSCVFKNRTDNPNAHARRVNYCGSGSGQLMQTGSLIVGLSHSYRF